MLETAGMPASEETAALAEQAAQAAPVVWAYCFRQEPDS